MSAWSGTGSSIGSIIGGTIGLIVTGGSPFGFAIGSAIGGYIGGTLDPGPGQTAIGPRLNDLRQQTGGYGQMLPIIYGTMRVAGTVIYLPPKVLETGEYVTQGGDSILQFAYSTSPAIALCDAADGPIFGIKRVWEDGKLVANYPNNIGPQHTLTFNDASYLNVYNGSETQAADPYLSDVPDSFAGARNDSAYRGTAYVFIRNRQLAKTFNRLGNLEFEVISKVGAIGTFRYLDTASQLGFTANASIAPDGNMLMANCTSNGPPRVVTLALRNPVTLAIITTYTTGTLPFSDHVDVGIAPVMNSGGDIMFFGATGQVYIWPSGGSPVQIGFTPSTRAYVDSSGNFYVCFQNTATTAFVLAKIAPGATTYTTLRTFPFTAAGTPRDLFDGNDGFLYVGYGTSSGTIEKINRSTGAVVSAWTPTAAPTTLCSAGDGSVWYVTGTTPQLRRINPAFTADTVISTASGPYTGSSNERLTQDWNTGDVIYTGQGGTASYRYSAAGVSAVILFPLFGYVVYSSPDFPLKVYTFNNLGTGHTQFVGIAESTSPDIFLDEVVTKICGRVGLTPADIDVTQLAADIVHGYAVMQQSEAREMLQPLMTAYFFDCVESGNKLKFVKRGAVPIGAPIPQADMGAQASGSQPGQPYSIIRKQETELPRQITLSFYDSDRDYQISTVYARRQVVHSVNDVSMNLALVFSRTEAQRIVNAMLYEAWASRTTISFSLSQKYSELEPTDVKNLALDFGTITVRFLSKQEGSGIMQISAAVIDGDLYTQTAVGDSSGAGGQTNVGDSAPTTLALLDTALLNPVDDTYGFYGEASGGSAGIGWAGAELFKSTDGTTFVHTSTGFSVSATLGTALSVLPDFGGGNVFDRNSTVNVDVSENTLDAATDLAVLNGANLAWLGGELIQFSTATLLGAGIYRLSGLLRGRMGTDWAMRRHVNGEVFALIDSSYKSITSVVADIGVEVKYKGVTFNTAESAVASQNFTLASNRLKPLSPVGIGGGRNAAGDIAINWRRRARKNADWVPLTDVPLDETTEAYEVDVFAGTPKTLTAISLANPGVFTTSAVHGLVVNDIIFIRGIVGPLALNDRPYYVASVPTTSTFTVRDRTGSLTGVVENASIYPAWVSGGSVYKLGRTIGAVTTTAPYSAANQTTDYGGTQATVYVSVYQSSSRVGRGYAGVGVV